MKSIRIFFLKIIKDYKYEKMKILMNCMADKINN